MNGRPSEQKFPVKLLRNYVPRGEFEIVGYDKAATHVKDAAGRKVELEPAEFVKGEMTPPQFAGSGFAETLNDKGEVAFKTKIWAQTHLKLPVAEAKEVIAKGIAERADALPA